MTSAIYNNKIQSAATPSRVSFEDGASLGWRMGLWSVQVALAFLFAASGGMKVFMSPEAQAAMGMKDALDIPVLLLRFIGVCEIAGAFGMILPALTRIIPRLTPLAALGFATIQILAIGFHFTRGELAMMAPINLTLLGMSLFVLWGRTQKAAITPRSRAARDE
jgi:uncharacterized membrane protein YphA (DoxX/SURF4 family)